MPTPPLLPMPFLRSLWLLLALGLLPAADILEVRWGFDGKVLPGHFNPLALLVRNGGPTPFDGALEVGEGTLMRQGAPWRAPCYLAPGTSRWVHLRPWIGDQEEEFQVRWLPGGAAHDLEKPAFGPPATVLLLDPGQVAPARLALKTFPDELFPDSVLATAGLACVVLDHAPRWQPAQRQALRDWLWRGGTLWLLPGADGSRAHFTQELVFLDQVATRQACGAGVVVRHEGARDTFTPAALAAGGFVAPVLHEADAYGPNLTSGVFQALTRLVRPHHPWALIYAVLLLYLLLLGPGAWLAARRGVDFRLVNAALAVLIVLTAAAMWLVGRRGYGEHAAVSSLAYAQSLGDGDFAVTQWSSVFVTSSDRYEIGHPGTDNLFACPSDSEQVEAVVLDQGGPSRLLASVPLYSSRPFIHSGRRTLAGLAPVIADSRLAGGRLESLRIAIPGAGADQRAWSARISAAYVHHGGLLHTMGRSGDGFILAAGPLDHTQLANQVRQSANVGAYYDDDGDDRGLRIAQLDQRFLSVIAYGLGGEGVQRHWCAAPSDPAQVTLFLLADLPPAFTIAGGISQAGRTVLRFDLPLPALPPARNAP